MNITDNWLLQNVSQTRRHWQLASYAAHLATGHTLLCKSIKADTVSKQIKHIADFHGQFGPDPRKLQSADAKISPLIINEVRHLERIPHLREPHTIKMQEWLETTAKDLPDDHPKKAFTDWAHDGLYGGWRKSEWAQPDSKHKPIGHHHCNNFGDPYAFCLGDYEFQTRFKSRVPLLTILTQPDQDILITRAEVTLCWQKNGQHNEIRVWVRSQRNPVCCKIRAMLRIVRRFVGLVGMRHDLPLSIYRDPSTGVVINFDSDIIRKYLREAASAVYHIDATTSDGRATLARWSSHSFRTGACVILYAAGFTDTQINTSSAGNQIPFAVTSVTLQ
jgi:hypothetical protein